METGLKNSSPSMGELLVEAVGNFGGHVEVREGNPVVRGKRVPKSVSAQVWAHREAVTKHLADRKRAYELFEQAKAIFGDDCELVEIRYHDEETPSWLQ